MAKGVGKDKAEEIFDFILKFGGYGFNKSHSCPLRHRRVPDGVHEDVPPGRVHVGRVDVRNGLDGKGGRVHRRVPALGDGRTGRKRDQGAAAGREHFRPRTSRRCTRPWRRRCRRRRKKKKASPRSKASIRFGMMAVRGVGEKAVEAIAAEQRETKGNYASLYDLCERIDLQAGAQARHDRSAHPSAAAFTSITPEARRSSCRSCRQGRSRPGQQTQNDKKSGQLNMFSGPATASSAPSVGGRRWVRGVARRRRVQERRAAEVREGAARVLHHQPPAD